MKIVICIIGNELTHENETSLMAYDDENTIIHLYTNAICEKISIAGILRILNQLELGDEVEHLWLISDMSEYLKVAERFYSELFSRFILLPYKETSFAIDGLLLEKSDRDRILFFSYLVEKRDDQEAFKQMNRLAIQSNELTLYNRFYYWRQALRICLRKKDIHDSEALQQLYQMIYQEYYAACKDLLKPISKSNRNEELIYVLTLQFIGLQHPPTKSALERINVLNNQLHKQVHVINTKEPMTALGEFPMYAPSYASVNDSLAGCRIYRYEGMVFSLDQSEREMPDIDEVRRILIKLRQDKPYMILAIGNGSIVADMASKIVPVVNIPVAFSSVWIHEGQYTAIGRKLGQKERLLYFGSTELPVNIIESTFSFSLNEQKNHYTRCDLKLPENRFLMLVVGTRLHNEVDDEFIEAMHPLLAKGAYLVFAGVFQNYIRFCRKDKIFGENSIFLGYQEDILAVDELVDLYVNPRRLGGGYSIIEAFSKGVPGVTLRTGDIAAAAGDDFCVENYQEMQHVIERYMIDPQFYSSQSEKAQKRVNEVTDAKEALQHIMNEAQSRALFF